MFHNIFSNKKTNTEKKDRIIVDHHEKNSLVPAELSKLGLQVEFNHLQVGDYLINDIIVERKTINDLKSSIINKRVFQQLIEIKQHPKFFLIIEGNQESLTNNETLHQNALRGFLLSVSLQYQVPYILTENEKDTALYLLILSKKKDHSDSSIRPSKIAFSKEEQIQYILEGFPGIGPVKAKELLQRFKSLKNIFNASVQELEEILGKKALDFLAILS